MKYNAKAYIVYGISKDVENYWFLIFKGPTFKNKKNSIDQKTEYYTVDNQTNSFSLQGCLFFS